MNIYHLINVKTLTYNWNIISTIPEFAKLKECQQSTKWHSEGTAWDHTKLVCEEAIKLYDYFNEVLRQLGFKVETGIFGADMKIKLLNDGPVTIIMDSRELV